MSVLRDVGLTGACDPSGNSQAVKRATRNPGAKSCAALSQNLRLSSPALAGVATIEAANIFLRDVFIPDYNRRFAVAPEHAGTAFVAVGSAVLAEILCVQEERQVGNDNCVSFNCFKLQLPESPLRAHFVKARVKVRQYHDASLAIFHGPRCLARYDKKGALETANMAA